MVLSIGENERNRWMRRKLWNNDVIGTASTRSLLQHPSCCTIITYTSADYWRKDCFSVGEWLFVFVPFSISQTCDCQLVPSTFLVFSCIIAYWIVDRSCEYFHCEFLNLDKQWDSQRIAVHFPFFLFLFFLLVLFSPLNLVMEISITTRKAKCGGKTSWTI